MKQMILSDAECPRTHLFMVRVWFEDLGDGKAEWRGQVKHVMSGEVRYFREWQTLLGHLKAVLACAEQVKEETPENKGA